MAINQSGAYFSTGQGGTCRENLVSLFQLTTAGEYVPEEDAGNIKQTGETSPGLHKSSLPGPALGFATCTLSKSVLTFPCPRSRTAYPDLPLTQSCVRTFLLSLSVGLLRPSSHPTPSTAVWVLPSILLLGHDLLLGKPSGGSGLSASPLRKWLEIEREAKLHQQNWFPLPTDITCKINNL